VESNCGTDQKTPALNGFREPFSPGDYYSFRTRPFTKYSPQETNRYAALKILALDEMVTFVVLDGIWSYPPNFDEASMRLALRNERFFSSERLAVYCVPTDWDPDLLELKRLGNRPVSEEELSIIPKLRSYGTWATASSDAEGEWRWRHDRDQVRLEVEQLEADQDAKRAETQRRYASRLRHLTWTKLRAEQVFSRWQESPPFPPPAFVDAARARIQQAVNELEALGSKPKKKDVRAALRSCVEWFNIENARFGDVIETEEREDICNTIEELAFLAGHHKLIDEVGGWKTW
jgi:hypothetical protein